MSDTSGSPCARWIAPYHPDLVREPEVPPSAPMADRRRLALVWNVFRSLEQVAPSFWLRRIVARLCGLTEGAPFGPQTVRVSCWDGWPLAPPAMLRRGRRGLVPVDVAIETEDVVLGLAAPRLSDLASTLADTAEVGLLELVEAVSWRAGVRHAHVGVLLPAEADPLTWVPRVQRRALMVLRALGQADPHVSNVRGVGALTWSELEIVLSEAAAASALPADDRAVASRAARWLSRTLSSGVVRA